MHQRIMVENSTGEFKEDDPDGVDDDTAIDSIPAIEGEEACSTTTVAAVSISIPDSPVTRVLHKIHNKVAEDGYDSDGFLLDGNLEEEETLIKEETVLDFIPRDAVNNEVAAKSKIDNCIFISKEALLKLNVDQLIEEQQKRGVSKTVKKAELQEKLQITLEKRTPLLSIERASNASNEFEEGARWQLLGQESEEQPDPENAVATAFTPSD